MAKITEHDWHVVDRQHIQAGKYRVDVEDARALGDDGELVDGCRYMRAHLEVVATGERIWTSAVYPSADYTPGKRLHHAKNVRDMLALAAQEAKRVESRGA
jgi:hypothetical protein